MTQISYLWEKQSGDVYLVGFAPKKYVANFSQTILIFILHVILKLTCSIKSLHQRKIFKYLPLLIFKLLLFTPICKRRVLPFVQKPKYLKRF